LAGGRRCPARPRLPRRGPRARNSPAGPRGESRESRDGWGRTVRGDGTRARAWTRLDSERPGRRPGRWGMEHGVHAGHHEAPLRARVAVMGITQTLVTRPEVNT
jgi:hypothetical protein